LVAAFDARASELTPTAAGTDVIGALWKASLLLETSTTPGATRTIYLLSDAVHESPDFNMPALLPQGPRQMLADARSRGLIVPLAGCEVHVLGASTAGLSPQLWTAIRGFWRAYVDASGGKLVRYVPDLSIVRQQ